MLVDGHLHMSILAFFQDLTLAINQADNVFTLHEWATIGHNALTFSGRARHHFVSSLLINEFEHDLFLLSGNIQHDFEHKSWIEGFCIVQVHATRKHIDCLSIRLTQLGFDLSNRPGLLRTWFARLSFCNAQTSGNSQLHIIASIFLFDGNIEFHGRLGSHVFSQLAVCHFQGKAVC